MACTSINTHITVYEITLFSLVVGVLHSAKVSIYELLSESSLKIFENGTKLCDLKPVVRQRRPCL